MGNVLHRNVATLPCLKSKIAKGGGAGDASISVGSCEKTQEVQGGVSVPAPGVVTAAPQASKQHPLGQDQNVALVPDNKDLLDCEFANSHQTTPQSLVFTLDSGGGDANELKTVSKLDNEDDFSLCSLSLQSEGTNSLGPSLPDLLQSAKSLYSKNTDTDTDTTEYDTAPETDTASLQETNSFVENLKTASEFDISGLCHDLAKVSLDSSIKSVSTNLVCDTAPSIQHDSDSGSFVDANESNPETNTNKESQEKSEQEDNQQICSTLESDEDLNESFKSSCSFETVQPANISEIEQLSNTTQDTLNSSYTTNETVILDSLNQTVIENTSPKDQTQTFEKSFSETEINKDSSKEEEIIPDQKSLNEENTTSVDNNTSLLESKEDKNTNENNISVQDTHQESQLNKTLVISENQEQNPKDTHQESQLNKTLVISENQEQIPKDTHQESQLNKTLVISENQEQNPKDSHQESQLNNTLVISENQEQIPKDTHQESQLNKTLVISENQEQNLTDSQKEQIESEEKADIPYPGWEEPIEHVYPVPFKRLTPEEFEASRQLAKQLEPKRKEPPKGPITAEYINEVAARKVFTLPEELRKEQGNKYNDLIFCTQEEAKACGFGLGQNNIDLAKVNFADVLYFPASKIQNFHIPPLLKNRDPSKEEDLKKEENNLLKSENEEGILPKENQFRFNPLCFPNIDPNSFQLSSLFDNRYNIIDSPKEEQLVDYKPSDLKKEENNLLKSENEEGNLPKENQLSDKENLTKNEIVREKQENLTIIQNKNLIKEEKENSTKAEEEILLKEEEEKVNLSLKEGENLEKLEEDNLLIEPPKVDEVKENLAQVGEEEKVAENLENENLSKAERDNLSNPPKVEQVKEKNLTQVEEKVNLSLGEGENLGKEKEKTEDNNLSKQKEDISKAEESPEQISEEKESLSKTEEHNFINTPKEGEVKEEFTKEEEVKEDFTKEEEVKEDFTKEEEVKEDFTKEKEVKEDFTKEVEEGKANISLVEDLEKGKESLSKAEEHNLSIPPKAKENLTHVKEEGKVNLSLSENLVKESENLLKTEETKEKEDPHKTEEVKENLTQVVEEEKVNLSPVEDLKKENNSLKEERTEDVNPIKEEIENPPKAQEEILLKEKEEGEKQKEKDNKELEDISKGKDENLLKQETEQLIKKEENLSKNDNLLKEEVDNFVKEEEKVEKEEKNIVLDNSQLEDIVKEEPKNKSELINKELSTSDLTENVEILKKDLSLQEEEDLSKNTPKGPNVIVVSQLLNQTLCVEKPEEEPLNLSLPKVELKDDPGLNRTVDRKTTLVLSDGIFSPLRQISTETLAKSPLPIVQPGEDSFKKLNSVLNSVESEPHFNNILEICKRQQRSLETDEELLPIVADCDFVEGEKVFGLNPLKSEDRSQQQGFDFDIISREAARLSLSLKNEDLMIEDDGMADAIGSSATYTKRGSTRGASPAAAGDDPFRPKNRLPNSPPLNRRASGDRKSLPRTPAKVEATPDPDVIPAGAEAIINANANHSEAGPETAAAVVETTSLVADNAFKDPSAFEFLSSVGSGRNHLQRDLRKESLYVKFDPLVGSIPANAELTSNVDNKPRRKTIREEPNANDTLLNTNPVVNETILLREDDTKTHSSSTPLKNPAIDIIDKLILLSPSPIKESTGATAPQAKDSHTQATPVKEKESNLNLKHFETIVGDNNKMKEELELVREMLTKQEKEYQEALGEKQKVIDSLTQKNKDLEDKEQKLNEAVKINERMNIFLKEYEKSISNLTAEKEYDRQMYEADKEALIKDKEQAMGHLEAIEVAFADLHKKYERAKNVIDGFKKNEEVLKMNLVESKETIREQEQKYELFKTHVFSQLESANQELDATKRSHQGDIAKLTAMLKKAEIKVSSLQEMLDQKVKENEELANICDELIAKVN